MLILTKTAICQEVVLLTRMKENDFKYFEVFICIPGSGHRSSFFYFFAIACFIAIFKHFVNKSAIFFVPTTTEKKS